MIELNQQDISDINDIILEIKGIDFSDYAASSYKRRITRFFDKRKISDITEFRHKMISGKNFADDLIDEITVNVTEMFRDPGFWVELKKSVLPSLSAKDEIKIWHAACSTGEEVYSMAILLKEAGLYDRCRITGTDINRPALLDAGKGIYPLKQQQTNSKNYKVFNKNKELSEYYSPETKDSVRFDPELLKNVEFRQHDLVKDESPGTYDLIICRNVFIYFNFSLQEKVLSKFCDSLEPDGFLGIGSKESISWTSSVKHFRTLSLEEKIFRKSLNVQRTIMI